MDTNKYVYLKDVKFAHTKKKQSSVFSLFYGYQEEAKEETHYTVVYHNKHKKWLVTDDISVFGLSDGADSVEVVGFADNIDAAIFVIWEHQKSLGLDQTVVDDIKAAKMADDKLARDAEWGWAKNTRGQTGYTYGHKPLRFNSHNEIDFG